MKYYRLLDHEFILKNGTKLDLGTVLNTDQYICVHWFDSLLEEKHKTALAQHVIMSVVYAGETSNNADELKAAFYEGMREWCAVYLPSLQIGQVKCKGEQVVDALKQICGRIAAGSDELKAFFTDAVSELSEGTRAEIGTIADEMGAIGVLQETVFAQVLFAIVKVKKARKAIENNKQKAKQRPSIGDTFFLTSLNNGEQF
jgi:hypothetical protein